MSDLERGAIVLGNNLSVVHELGRKGIDCTVMVHNRPPSTYSRFAKYVRCVNPALHEDRAIEFLYDRCQKMADRPVVIPVSDQWVMALSRHRDRMGEVCAPCVAGRQAAERLMDKRAFCRLGQERGYMAPRCWTHEDVADVKDEVFPIVAKPRLHRWSSNEDQRVLQRQMLRLRFTVLRNRVELNGFLSREERWLDHLFFQEYVRGPSSNLYDFGAYIDRSGKVLASVSGHKIRGCLSNHGDCNLGESCVLPEKLVSNVMRIIHEQGITGLVEFEYKQDADSGEFKLIEVNPRAWAWCGLAPACGADLPLIAYQDLTGSYDPAAVVPFKGTVRYVRLFYDLPNCLIYSRRNNPEWKRSLGQWRNDIKADRVVFEELGSGDWLVTVIQATEALQTLVGRSLRHLSRKNAPSSRDGPLADEDRS
ncbi:MAG: hypothetical protein SA339_04375 [Methanomassiliicoccus sp.]|nr:hypothetical protein [Methanomassiliicoccus sp.]